VKNFFTAGATHFLKHVRPHSHAAGGAFFVANSGERHAVVFSGDARVMVKHAFGDIGDHSRTLGIAFCEFFFTDSSFGLDFRSVGPRGFLDFLQGFFGGLDAAVVLLAGNHLFKQAIFGLGDFVFGHLRFVLKRFVGFVRFYLEHLVFIFADSLLPLLDVEFVSFAVFDGGELGSLALLDVGASGRDAGVDFR